MWDKRGDMIVHEHRPYNAESPLVALIEPITPTSAFYVRNHGEVPRVHEGRWWLRVDGLVDDAVELGPDELRGQLEQHTVTATMQCAGNRRAGLIEVRDIPGEDPWGPGATSTARWTGFRLRDVLAAAGVRTGAGHVAFTGQDMSPIADPPQTFGGSIPLSKAVAPEVLVAVAMNGQPLPPVHGGPVRVVVPGYIGARSIKWLRRITVQNGPSENFFQANAYRLLPVEANPATAGPGDGLALSSVALNADILAPDDHAHVVSGPVAVTGYAYAGDDRTVARVDVSTDEGRTWTQAVLDPPPSPWSWQHWRTTVTLAPGPHTVTARAWDSTGASQPESARHLWNPKGYVNNAWPRVRLLAG